MLNVMIDRSRLQKRNVVFHIDWTFTVNGQVCSPYEVEVEYVTHRKGMIVELCFYPNKGNLTAVSVLEG